MESLSHYEHCLMNLETLREKLTRYEKECLPDYFGFSPGDIGFVPCEDHDEGHHVEVKLHGKDPENHTLTEWSRKQLLSLMGTRERWFSRVEAQVEASELKRREQLGALSDYKLRLRHPVDSEVPEVRGIVSKYYTSINDTEVLSRVEETLPQDSYRILNRFTAKEEHITHIFLVLREPLGVSGGLQGFAAVTIRNSEVGASALNIGTSLVVPAGNALTQIWTNRTKYRRIHKGSKKSLLTDFKEAAHDAATAGQDTIAKSAKLSQVVFDTEGGAKDFIEDTLKRYKAPQGFINRSKEAFYTRGEKPTGLDVVKSIVVASSTSHRNVDAAHTEGTIAGAVLLRLIRM